jgi:hypothetical protein
VPLDQVIPWYEAYAAFTEELHNTENTVYFKLKEGMSANHNINTKASLVNSGDEAKIKSHYVTS